MKTTFRFLAATAVVLAAGSASAAVTGGAKTGGTTPGTFILLASPPAQVGDNRQQDGNLYAWNETQGVVLAAPLAIDIGGASIAAGTFIASHGIVFDPGPSASIIGFVTFDRPILGVITTRAKLRDSDYLGPLTAFDDVGARGLEDADFAGTSFSGNTLTINRWTASDPGDNIRVITAGVPEPATWAMLIAGFGLVGFAARRRRISVSA